MREETGFYFYEITEAAAFLSRFHPEMPLFRFVLMSCVLRLALCDLVRLGENPFPPPCPLVPLVASG